MLPARLQIISGKGGVGKTTVACALALRSAEAGKKTLLLEVADSDAAAACLGARPAVDQPREVLPNFFLCRMTPAGALSEYTHMALKVRALHTLIFENRWVRSLLQSIPSLAEFVMLGKTWFHHTERGSDGRPRYDQIILDAPSTGHALTFLSVAKTVAGLCPPGRMRTASQRIADFLASDQVSTHVVFIPEEMAVEEGLNFVQSLGPGLGLHFGRAIVNRTSSLKLSTSGQEALLRLLEISSPSDGEIWRFLLGWRGLQQRQQRFVHHVEAQIGRPSLQICDYGFDGLQGIELVRRIMTELGSMETND